MFFLLILFLSNICSSTPLAPVDTIPLEEKIAASFIQIVDMMPKPDATQKEHIAHIAEVHEVLRTVGVGGILPLQKSTLAGLQETLAACVAVAKKPLPVFFDAEWGPAMRLVDQPAYPKASELGAGTLENTFFTARAIAQACKNIGIHVNLAPVADVVSPEISASSIVNRSFGAHPQKVAQHASVYATAHVDVGVGYCYKHFPGHGSVTTDTHTRS